MGPNSSKPHTHTDAQFEADTQAEAMEAPRNMRPFRALASASPWVASILAILSVLVMLSVDSTTQRATTKQTRSFLRPISRKPGSCVAAGFGLTGEPQNNVRPHVASHRDTFHHSSFWFADGKKSETVLHRAIATWLFGGSSFCVGLPILGLFEGNPTGKLPFRAHPIRSHALLRPLGTQVLAERRAGMRR